MENIAISVQNVGKMYKLFDKPVDRLKHTLFWRFGMKYGRDFWALQNVSLSIKQGETFGIIGKNGSGKSTLLQIITGTLTPTVGQVSVGGRVAALLELGSGFNPDYTGRENVYMNGAILGVSADEMNQHFDEIVAFADIGDFLDQPVKMYSSGMLVRLAFAVQAFIPKQVLVVDEALSVGDMFFQAKCIYKMKQLINDGVTVLFVSHDIASVKSLCSRAMLLDKGQVVEIGKAEHVVQRYYEMKVTNHQGVVPREDDLAQNSVHSNQWFSQNEEFRKSAGFQRIQNGKVSFVNVLLLNQNEEPIHEVEYDQEVTLRMCIESSQEIPIPVLFGYHIKDRNGIDLIYSDSVIEDCTFPSIEANSRYIIDWRFRASLKEGNYSIVSVLSLPIDLSQSLVEMCDFVPIALTFQVLPRVGSYLYGSMHWNNTIEIHRV